MGGREFLGKYLNSASKNTSETDIFPHGTKSLLTSVISRDDIVRIASRYLIDVDMAKVQFCSKNIWVRYPIMMRN